ncbi:MAG: hypothetical protein PF541_05170 [Prolixibacteraceae bacterium]|jgi:hypothetical protein|nr:hypothetical protein [Prolixibacteraceae bacterium]
MIKHLLLVIVVLAMAVCGYSQEIEKAPKFKSFEIGQRYLASSTFDMKNMGTTFLFDYAWQLSGFTGKPAGYISVPLGYTYFYAGEGEKTGGILSYGWTVRHDLKANQKHIPFFGYGLLLNQLRMKGIDGSSFGHQTRFDFGYQFNADQKVSPYVKIEYSYTRYPHLGVTESDKIHSVEIKGGVRF